LIVSSQVQKVLEKRILKEGEKSWDDVCKRVATFLAAGDDILYQEFYDVLIHKLFLPNSPCLVNAGGPAGTNQLFACFVLPVEDDMNEIFQTLKDTAHIHKTGGGTGFNFSNIRPSGSKVGKHGGVASGPISFMKIFDVATEQVKQGGVRRGANMAVLNCDHPDILDFITCKTNENAINNFNLSVGISDDFMSSLNGISDVSNKNNYLFDKIVEQAWLNGEPGVLFLDTINQAHRRVTGIKTPIEATNPCGEQPLLPYEACCLGSINLANIDKVEGYDLASVTRIGVTMLNQLIDLNDYPLERIKKTVMKNRKIGLGVMGYADFLIQNKVRYGSSEALEVTRRVAQIIKQEANSTGAIYNNKTTTTIAPTGTLSIIAECSSGIEPNFSWKSTIQRIDETFEEFAPIIVETASEYGLAPQLFLSATPLPEYFVTSQQVSPEEHVRTQAVWQEYIDNAVSKTINLPSHATHDDVRNSILLAYKLGCKGLTVYRDGSRNSQVISDAAKSKPQPSTEVVAEKRERPDVVFGCTPRFATGCGNLYVTVNQDDRGNIIEVFSNTGKGGGCPSQSEALTRIIAKSLQLGVPKEEIYKQLKGIKCSSCTNRNLGVTSCPDAMARAIQGEIPTPRVDTPLQIDNNTTHVCPSCNTTSNFAGGCFTCPECGFSKCG
jgi:ribonucleoside-diphosphate reductase alpha chain